MKNLIITLLVLPLSLTSCKQKEDINKKYNGYYVVRERIIVANLITLSCG